MTSLTVSGGRIWDEELLAEMQAAVEKAMDQAAAGAQTSMLGPDFVANNPNGVFLYQQLRELTPPLDPNMTSAVEGRFFQSRSANAAITLSRGRKRAKRHAGSIREMRDTATHERDRRNPP